MLGLQSLNLEQVPNIDVHQILDLLEWNPRLYIKVCWTTGVYNVHAFSPAYICTYSFHIELMIQEQIKTKWCSEMRVKQMDKGNLCCCNDMPV